MHIDCWLEASMGFPHILGARDYYPDITDEEQRLRNLEKVKGD